MLDLHLAIAHHILIFCIFGVVAAELSSVRPGMTVDGVRRIARIDTWYGILAGFIVVVGFSRALFAAKGWEYYLYNAFFWSKIGTFVVIGVLSVPPTVAFIRWRRAGVAPTDGQVATIRRFLWAETGLFALVVGFAAAMARGYGEF
jgi:putative membrane protein